MNFVFIKQQFDSLPYVRDTDIEDLISDSSVDLNQRKEHDFCLSLIDSLTEPDEPIIDFFAHHSVVLAPYLLSNSSFIDFGGRWMSMIDSEGNPAFIYPSSAYRGGAIVKTINISRPYDILNQISNLSGVDGSLRNISSEYCIFLDKMKDYLGGRLIDDHDLNNYFGNVLGARCLQNKRYPEDSLVHPQAMLMSHHGLVFSFLGKGVDQTIMIPDEILPVHPYFSSHLNSATLNKNLMENLVAKQLVDVRYKNTITSVNTYGLCEYHKGYMFDGVDLDLFKERYYLDNPWMKRRIYYVGDNANGHFIYGDKDDVLVGDKYLEMVNFLERTGTSSYISRITKYFCNLIRYIILYSHYMQSGSIVELLGDFRKFIMMAPPIKDYMNELLSTVFDGYKELFNWNSYNDFKTMVINGGVSSFTLPEFFDYVQDNARALDIIVKNKEIDCFPENCLLDYCDESLGGIVYDSPDIVPLIDVPVVDLDVCYSDTDRLSGDQNDIVRDLIFSAYAALIFKKNPGLHEKGVEDLSDKIYNNLKIKIFHYGDRNYSFKASCLTIVRIGGKFAYMDLIDRDIDKYSVKFECSRFVLVRCQGLIFSFALDRIDWSSLSYLASMCYGVGVKFKKLDSNFYLEFYKSLDLVSWYGDG